MLRSQLRAWWAKTRSLFYVRATHSTHTEQQQFACSHTHKHTRAHTHTDTITYTNNFKRTLKSHTIRCSKVYANACVCRVEYACCLHTGILWLAGWLAGWLSGCGGCCCCCLRFCCCTRNTFLSRNRTQRVCVHSDYCWIEFYVNASAIFFSRNKVYSAKIMSVWLVSIGLCWCFVGAVYFPIEIYDLCGFCPCAWIRFAFGWFSLSHTHKRTYRVGDDFIPINW